MAKVEWSRLSGDDVEELCAILVCRKNPQATRIRPSIGDGGIDLLVPTGNDNFGVYQVKKFSSNLTPSQKRQIRDSIERLEKYRVDVGISISAWHLALPLDPTNENLDWLRGIAETVPYAVDWRGRAFLDGLAAEFPDVVDYYVGDGRARLESVVRQLTAAMSMKPNEGDGVVSPAQLGDYLATLAPALNTDPHFRYEVSVGPLKPYIQHEPGLIVAMVQSAKDYEDSAVTVKVFPRFAAALDFRPIPGTLTIRAAPGSELQQQLANFRKFGTEISAPQGTVDVHMDLPGGLDGTAAGAALRMFPVPVKDNGKRLLRMATVAPNGTVEASVLVDMDPPTFGLDRTGARTTGTAQEGAFKVELLTDTTTGTMTINWSTQDLSGKHPHDVIKGLHFLETLQSPNQLAIAAPHGPLGQTTDLSSATGSLNAESQEVVLAMTEALAAIQERTAVQIVIPNMDSIGPREIHDWRAAERLLAGEDLTATTTGIRTCLQPEVTVPKGKFAIAWNSDYSVKVGADDIPLGTLLTYC